MKQDAINGPYNSKNYFTEVMMQNLIFSLIVLFSSFSFAEENPVEEIKNENKKVSK